MKNHLLVGLAVVALVCAAALPSSIASPKVADNLILKAPEGVKMTKAPVPFPHKLHVDAKIDCFVCHHTAKTEAEITGCSVEGCHSDASKAAKKDPKGFYQAWHSKKNLASCVACHKKEKKADKAFTGPVSCKDCHPKK